MGLPRITVCLRISGEDLEPEEISNLLKAQPTRAFRKGQPLSFALDAPVARTGVWILEPIGDEAHDHERQIHALLSLLPTDVAVWSSLASQFHCEVFCGVFMAELNQGFAFSPKLLEAISKCHLSLSFDFHYVGHHDS